MSSTIPVASRRVISSPDDSHNNHIHVICVTGPIGYGKTTFAEKLVNANVVHVDGDMPFGIAEAETYTLGGDRNDVTIGNLINIVCQGKIPVISCGGGVLLDLHKKFSTIFPENKLVFTIYVAGNEDIEKFYADSSDITKTSIANRIKDGKWSADTNIIEIFQKSIKNAMVVKTLVELADHVHYWDRTTIPPHIDLVQGSVNKIITLQRRTYVAYTIGDKVFGWHVTLSFGSQETPIDEIVKEHEPRDFLGTLIEIVPTVPPKKALKVPTQFIAVHDPTRYFDTLEYGQVHITVSAHPYAPKDMKTACMLWHQDPDAEHKMPNDIAVTFKVIQNVPIVARFNYFA